MERFELDSDRSFPLTDDNHDDLAYNLRHESLPDAPIYKVQVQDALRDTKMQLGGLYSTMARSPMILNVSSTIATLAQQSKQLSEFDYPRTRTIGLVGDSGVGWCLC